VDRDEKLTYALHAPEWFVDAWRETCVACARADNEDGVVGMGACGAGVGGTLCLVRARF
jgi:hypothetical protein